MCMSSSWTCQQILIVRLAVFVQLTEPNTWNMKYATVCYTNRHEIVMLAVV